MTEFKKSFSEVLANVRRAMSILSNRDYCAGLCEDLKREGPRSYTQKSPLINEVCSRCGKKPNPELNR